MISIEEKLIQYPEFHEPFLGDEKMSSSIKSLVEKFNSNIKDGLIEFEEANCLCGNEKFCLLTSIDKNSINHKTVICKKCGLIQTNPRYTNVALSDFLESNIYKNLYYGGSYEKYAYEKFNISTGLPIYNDLIKYTNINENTKILEIGCAAGWNLLPFIDKKAYVLGIDYNNKFVEIGKNIGLNLKHGTIYELNEKFDIIIINKMFSIILEPLEILKKIKEILNPNGFLYLNVLNNERFDFKRIYNIRLNYFTPESLHFFVSQSGFKRLGHGKSNNDYSFAIFKQGIEKINPKRFYKKNLAKNLKSIKKFNFKYKLNKILKKQNSDEKIIVKDYPDNFI